jgi:hypothetical protein
MNVCLVAVFAVRYVPIKTLAIQNKIIHSGIVMEGEQQK